MNITYFNWHEIYQLARGDLAAIVILTYAQSKSYNTPIAWHSGKSLLNKLNIHHIPAFLFQTGTLEAMAGNIFCSYKTKEIQSYINNSKFITYNVSAHLKTDYIKALSMRRISDKTNKIHRSYIEDDIDNPFLTFDKNFIYFRYESLVTENKS